MQKNQMNTIHRILYKVSLLWKTRNRVLNRKLSRLFWLFPLFPYDTTTSHPPGWWNGRCVPLRSMEAIPQNTSVRETARHMKGVHEFRVSWIARIKPGWWNGRHERLKISWQQCREGSIPSPGTKKIKQLTWKRGLFFISIYSLFIKKSGNSKRSMEMV